MCEIYKQEPYWDSDASCFSLRSLSSITHPHRLKGAWKMLVGQTFTLSPSNNLFTFSLSLCLFLMFCLSFLYYAVSAIKMILYQINLNGTHHRSGHYSEWTPDEDNSKTLHHCGRRYYKKWRCKSIYCLFCVHLISVVTLIQLSVLACAFITL